MPRPPRVVIPGYPHHIIQRGVRRSDVFFDIEDRKCYLKLLQKYSNIHGIKTLSYCLMTNHVHHIMIPRDKNSFENTFRDLDSEYATYVNKKQNCSGHLWQARYFSSVMDDDYLSVALRYVELNPVRAGMVQNAEDYIWSSAPAHVRGHFDPVLAVDETWNSRLNEFTDNWGEWLRSELCQKKVNFLRVRTAKGAPSASDYFIEQLEEQTGLKLKPRPQGRPRKLIGL